MGSIEFGTSQSHHILRSPQNSFGPNDTIAYVAHVSPRTPIPPNTKLHEYFSRVDAKGHLTPILNDTFSLKVTVHNFVTLNSIAISELYRAGFTAPAKYQVRLMHGAEQLAIGLFSLK